MPWQINPRLLRSEPLRRCGFPECKAACCLYGVWVDLFERDRILELAAEVSVLLLKEHRDPAQWFEDVHEADPHCPSGQVVHTRVLVNEEHYGGSTCIFLRPDHNCALQLAGEKLNKDGWSLKPFYCILHPLDLDEDGRISLDETHLLAEEAASCLVPSEDPVPLLITFAPELCYFLGDDEFERLSHFPEK